MEKHAYFLRDESRDELRCHLVLVLSYQLLGLEESVPYLVSYMILATNKHYSFSVGIDGTDHSG